MRAETVSRLGLALLIAALVALGLLAVGGPSTGRLEQRDAERAENLRDLSTYVTCLAEAASGTLPEALSENADCPGEPRFDDPFTGAPYRYERLSPAAYRFCAEFEAPERVRRPFQAGFDRESGCLTFRYRP